MDAHQDRPRNKHARNGGLTFGDWIKAVDLRLKAARFDYSKTFQLPANQDFQQQFAAGRTPEEAVEILLMLQRTAYPPGATR